MEVFLLVVAFFSLILFLNSKFKGLHEKVDTLNNELKKIQHQSIAPVAKKSRLEDEDVARAFTKPQPQAVPAALANKAPEVQKEEVRKEEFKPEEVSKPVEKVVYPKTISEPSMQEPMRLPIQKAPKPKTPTFFERNPDLEKFIGENLANKIGIGILVLGIGFFVKYAIDQEWIGVIGRVFIGILCGGILLGVAHKLRNTFKAFSSVLVGGGIAVLYLTIAIAFHEYQIFTQTAAFVIMVIITAFAVFLSLGYDRIELAILSILGGFASPFMVSTGEGNYVVLFTYILILDIGMLVLAYYKKWNLVNIVSYAFTILLFGAWLGGEFDGENTSMIGSALVFATAFYLVFFAMNIINNLKERTSFKAIEITLLLSNTFFYYAAGMTILHNDSGEMYKGLFTATLGVFNFIFAFILQRSGRVDKNLVFLLIGLVLTFISLAAPVQLEGNHITLFWAAEAVLLLWLSQKSGIRLMKLASVIITMLMIFSLVMDWTQLYQNSSAVSLPIILNRAYVTGFVSILSLVGTFLLLKNEKSESPENINLYKTAITFAGLVILYMFNFLELQYQLFAHGFDYATQNIIIGSYNMLFMAALLIFTPKLTVPDEFKKVLDFLGVFAMLTYLFFYHNQIIAVRNDYLNSITSSTGFIFHYVLLVLLLGVVAFSLPRIRKRDELNQRTYYAYSWFYVFFFVFMASAELDNIVVMSAFSEDNTIENILSHNRKIGYPILWGITSFILIAVGLKRKLKHLRIISLTLFLITLLKLFLVDIKGISEGGKIAAFISLGILLLVVSFMYQRLKKLLLADAPVVEKKDDKDIV